MLRDQVGLGGFTAESVSPIKTFLTLVTSEWHLLQAVIDQKLDSGKAWERTYLLRLCRKHDTEVEVRFIVNIPPPSQLAV